MKKFKTKSTIKKRKRKLSILIILLLLSIIVFNKVKKININPLNMKKIVFMAMGLKYQEESKNVFKEQKDNDYLIYIYNTHQKEEYKYDKISPFNIDYTVMFASYLLKEKLLDNNILSVVETSSITGYLNENNLSYGNSYEASRYFMENAYTKNPTLRYFVDIHRDSGKHELVTCNFENKDYAKILFVLGKENANYEKNKSHMEKLNEILKNKVPCISRGILEKEGEKVNGIYNQDFNEYVFLIEIGSNESFIEEVSNTVDIISKGLIEFIKE